MRVTARLLLQLLEQRHSRDVFVPECKDGRTLPGGHRRLDAWAMRRSWSTPTTFGYEIKVARSDFVGDEKWVHYLPLCSQLYFVCPSGLIRPEELPESVGLLWAARTGSRLYAKRKAPHRQVDIPESLWRYLLICRARIGAEWDTESQSDYWRNWLEVRREKRSLGKRVGRAIREHVQRVENENRRLKRQMDEMESCRRMLQEIGITPDMRGRWELRRRIDDYRHVLPQQLQRRIEGLHEQLGETLSAIKELERADEECGAAEGGCG